MLPDQCKFQIDTCELCRRELHTTQMELVRQQNPKWYTPKGVIKTKYHSEWYRLYTKAVSKDPEKVPCFIFEKAYDPYDYSYSDCSCGAWPPEDVKMVVCARHLAGIAEQLEQWQP